MGILPRFCFRRVDSPLLASYSSNFAAIMMRDLFVLCLVPLAVLSTPMPYKDDGYDKEYKGDSYDGDSYTKDDGYGKKLVCKPIYDTVYKEYCESYYDRICRTTHKEKCTDVPYQHCDAVLTNQQKRKCFEVEEVVCKLREDVKYQTVQVGFTVQKCNKVRERVCDTVYDVTSSTKEKNICINVHNPYCKHEEKTIIDRTCRTSTKFDCPTEYGYGKDSYGKGKDYKKPECHKSSSTSCYDTPRTVIVPKCSTTTDKVCETVHQRYPDVSERQHCHNEDKKVCELEERTQPKQVKKYVYTKQCRKVPRKVCENADNKSLVPSCVSSMRKECTHTPTESCDDIPKQHCFKVAQVINRCDETRQVPGPEPTYPEPTYPAPKPTYQTPEPTYPAPQPLIRRARV